MNNLQVVEYSNQRVLTTQQLAEIYETSTNNIKFNFNNNKERFVEGRDYYLLKGNNLKEFKNYVSDTNLVDKRAPHLYLWTEREDIWYWFDEHHSQGVCWLLTNKC